MDARTITLISGVLWVLVFALVAWNFRRKRRAP